MFRPATQAFLRTSARVPSFTAPRVSRRFASSSTATSSSWRSLAVRLGLAGGAVYYYNTNPIFAEEPAYAHFAPQDPTAVEPLPTLDSIAAQKRERLTASQSVETAAATGSAPASSDAPEEEADSQGAFNPETGEINWDCPCLGGMAHGPCGEEFKAAFSCFVYSNEEPKGMDCIEKFKGMQDCFRRYPEVYGAELEDDEDDDISDVPPPAPEAFENPSPDPTKPPPAELLSAAPEVHEENMQPQEAAAGTSKTQPAPRHPENKHPIDGEIDNEIRKAATKQIKREHAALDDDDLPKSLSEKRDAYKEKK